MTDPWDPFDDAKLTDTHGRLALRLLRFMASHARLQDNIDWVVRGWARIPADERSRILEDALFSSPMTDRRRPQLFISVIRDSNSDFDSRNFVATFNRVRDVRNHAAHAMYFSLMKTDDHVVLGVPHYHDDPVVERLENKKSNIDDSTLEKRERDMQWLLEVVEWVASEASVEIGPGGLNRTPGTVPPPSSRDKR